MRFLVGDRQFPIRPGISSEPEAVKHVILNRYAQSRNPGETTEVYTLEINSIERFVELTQKHGAHYISLFQHPYPELPDVLWQIVDVK